MSLFLSESVGGYYGNMDEMEMESLPMSIMCESYELDITLMKADYAIEQRVQSLNESRMFYEAESTEKNFVTKAWDAIVKFCKMVWEKIKKFVRWVWEKIRGFFSKIWAMIRGAAAGAKQAFNVARMHYLVEMSNNSIPKLVRDLQSAKTKEEVNEALSEFVKENADNVSKGKNLESKGYSLSEKDEEKLAKEGQKAAESALKSLEKLNETTKAEIVKLDAEHTSLSAISTDRAGVAPYTIKATGVQVPGSAEYKGSAESKNATKEKLEELQSKKEIQSGIMKAITAINQAVGGGSPTP